MMIVETLPGLFIGFVVGLTISAIYYNRQIKKMLDRINYLDKHEKDDKQK